MELWRQELYHHGILGMKWGVRRYRNKDGSLTSAGQQRYRSKGIKAAIARKKNEKVDAGFKNWNENVKKRDNAIELGKKANAAKLAYEHNRSDKDAKAAYKQANKDYKKALKENTTYRKGVVRQEVGRDIAGKHLSEARKVRKQLRADPTNKQLQKQYNDLMSKHDIERAKARRAGAVGKKRSQRKASVKRAMTMTVKAAATTAVVSAGAYAVNRYLSNRNTTINGRPAKVTPRTISSVMEFVKKGKDALGYFY